MKPVLIKNFKIGANIYGFYICKKIECKLTRLGDEYLDLLLQDKTGLIRGNDISFKNNYIHEYGSFDQHNKRLGFSAKGIIKSFNELSKK